MKKNKLKRSRRGTPSEQQKKIERLALSICTPKGRKASGYPSGMKKPPAEETWKNSLVFRTRKAPLEFSCQQRKENI